VWDSFLADPNQTVLVKHFTTTSHVLFSKLRCIRALTWFWKNGGQPKFSRGEHRCITLERHLMQLVDIPATLNALTNLALALKDNPPGAIAIVAITACLALWMRGRDK
jgi:hypothetical protein